MKTEPINLTIPPGARIITVGFGETTEESDDAVRAAFEKAEKDGIASIPISDSKQGMSAVTSLDILRTRGTPIEMIYSTLAAGDIETANAMFRTTVLEYIFEKLQAIYPGDDIQFINSRQLQCQGDEQVGLLIEGPGRGIAFTPEFDAIPFDDKGFVPICSIDAGRAHLVITDDGNAAILAIIEDRTNRAIDIIKDGIANAGVKKETKVHFRIGTDLSTITVTPYHTDFHAEVSIGLLAYIPHVN